MRVAVGLALIAVQAQGLCVPGDVPPKPDIVEACVEVLDNKPCEAACRSALVSLDACANSVVDDDVSGNQLRAWQSLWHLMDTEGIVASCNAPNPVATQVPTVSQTEGCDGGALTVQLHTVCSSVIQPAQGVCTEACTRLATVIQDCEQVLSTNEDWLHNTQTGVLTDIAVCLGATRPPSFPPTLYPTTPTTPTAPTPRASSPPTMPPVNCMNAPSAQEARVAVDQACVTAFQGQDCPVVCAAQIQQLRACRSVSGYSELLAILDESGVSSRCQWVTVPIAPPTSAGEVSCASADLPVEADVANACGMVLSGEVCPQVCKDIVGKIAACRAHPDVADNWQLLVNLGVARACGQGGPDDTLSPTVSSTPQPTAVLPILTRAPSFPTSASPTGQPSPQPTAVTSSTTPTTFTTRAPISQPPSGAGCDLARFNNGALGQVQKDCAQLLLGQACSVPCRDTITNVHACRDQAALSDIVSLIEVLGLATACSLPTKPPSQPPSSVLTTRAPTIPPPTSAPSPVSVAVAYFQAVLAADYVTQPFDAVAQTLVQETIAFETFTPTAYINILSHNILSDKELRIVFSVRAKQQQSKEQLEELYRPLTAFGDWAVSSLTILDQAPIAVPTTPAPTRSLSLSPTSRPPSRPPTFPPTLPPPTNQRAPRSPPTNRGSTTRPTSPPTIGTAPSSTTSSPTGNVRTRSPTRDPTRSPTRAPTSPPTNSPTAKPTSTPTRQPTSPTPPPRPDYYAPVEFSVFPVPFQRSAMSCAALGWDTKPASPVICASGEKSGECMQTRVSHGEAVLMCQSMGARLCTSLELELGEASLSCSAQRKRRFWTSDECVDENGYVGAVSQSASGQEHGHFARPACSRMRDRFRVRCCADAAPALLPQPGPKSCAELGWTKRGKKVGQKKNKVCTRSEIKGECYALVDFATAVRLCTSVGGRLCTLEELQNDVGVDGTVHGCGLDLQRVWSSTPCQGGVVTLGGSSDAEFLHPPMCFNHRESDRSGARCCADSAVGPSTAVVRQADLPMYSCEELGWSTFGGLSSVCAYSKVLSPTRSEPAGRCPGRRSFLDAQSICSDAGSRICSLFELLQDEAANTGCGLDLSRVWTRILCEGGALTVGGTSQGAREHVPLCLDLATELGVRCCSVSAVSVFRA